MHCAIDLDKDSWFGSSPDGGDPDCLCSRCNLVIHPNHMPVRFFLDLGAGTVEYRYHAICWNKGFREEEFRVPPEPVEPQPTK